MKSSKRPDEWGTLSEEALGAFKELKKRLTEAPILALPQRQGAHTLLTDASAGQVGAVLVQEQPDQSSLPVGCWSRSVNAAERNYSTKERECLAVVWVSLLVRPYVEGTLFLVRTDHAALKCMLHMDCAHGRHLNQRRDTFYEFIRLPESAASYNSNVGQLLRRRR